MKLKFFFFFVIVFAFISSAYSSSCVTSPDEYVLKCNYRADLIGRDFMCLNGNCSDKIYMYDNKIVIMNIGNYSSIQVYDGIVSLKDIRGYTQYLRQLCEDKISDNFLAFLNRKIREYDLQTDLYKGEKIIIMPFSSENYEKALARDVKSNSELFDNCYENNVEMSAGWVIESRKLKSYCSVVEDNGCMIAVVNKWEFFKYLIKDESDVAKRYLFSLLLGFGFVLGIFGFFVHLAENRGFKEFFRIEKFKLFITLIIMIPCSYLFGVLLDKVFFDIYYQYPFLKEAMIIFSVLVSYVIASFVYFYFISYRKYEREGRIRRREITGFEKRKL